MKCPHCGFENIDSSKHCLNCGARMDGNILCPKCGEAISPDYERCPHCNHKIPHLVEEEISPEEYSKKERVSSIFNKIFIILIITLLAFSMVAVYGEYVLFYKSGELIRGDAIYFLAKSWKYFKNDLSIAPNAAFKVRVYFEYISQFAIVAINIAIVTIASIVGIIKSAFALKKKGLKECDTYKYLCIDFLSNLTAITFLLSLHGDLGDMKSAFSPVMESYCGGMILTMLVMSIFSIVIRHENGKKVLTFEKIVFSLNYFISILLIISFAAPLFVDNDANYSYRIGSLFLTVINDFSSLNKTNMGVALIFASSSLVLFEAMEVFLLASLMIFFSIGFFTSRERSMRFKLPCYSISIFVSILSVIEFGMSIAAMIFTKKIYGGELTLSMMPISNLVLAILLIGSSIASFSITRMYRHSQKLAEHTTIKK